MSYCLSLYITCEGYLALDCDVVVSNLYGEFITHFKISIAANLTLIKYNYRIDLKIIEV